MKIRECENCHCVRRCMFVKRAKWWLCLTCLDKLFDAHGVPR